MANLIDFNINQLAIMIACVRIMDVLIFQKSVACVYLLLRRLCMLCLFSRIGVGRGKGSKHSRLECTYFTIFGSLQGTYITAVAEPNVRVQMKALLARYGHKQDRYGLHYVFWVFLSICLCFVI